MGILQPRTANGPSNDAGRRDAAPLECRGAFRRGFILAGGALFAAHFAACAGAPPDGPPPPPGPEAVAGWRMVDLSHA